MIKIEKNYYYEKIIYINYEKSIIIRIAYLILESSFGEKVS
jgi:hypothetical protein